MKFALVGCGLIGKKRIESLIELNEEIAGIYDSDKERLNKVSKDYDLKKYKIYMAATLLCSLGFLIVKYFCLLYTSDAADE